MSWEGWILIMRGWLRSTGGSATMGSWGDANTPSISSFSAKAFSKAALATFVTQIIRTTADKPKEMDEYWEDSNSTFLFYFLIQTNKEAPQFRLVLLSCTCAGPSVLVNAWCEHMWTHWLCAPHNTFTRKRQLQNGHRLFMLQIVFLTLESWNPLFSSTIVTRKTSWWFYLELFPCATWQVWRWVLFHKHDASTRQTTFSSDECPIERISLACMCIWMCFDDCNLPDTARPNMMNACMNKGWRCIRMSDEERAKAHISALNLIKHI